MSRLVAEMDKELDGVETGRFELSQGMRDSSECPVLSDLLKDVPRLMSEEPKEILKFCLDVKAIYDLKLVPVNVFWKRLLPKVRGSLLTFFGPSIKMENHGMYVKLAYSWNIFHYLSRKR